MRTTSRDSFKEPNLPVSFKDVWFNGHRHLERAESLGAKQGEDFTKGIKEKGWDWNAAFDGKSVVIPNSGEFVRTLLGALATLVYLIAAQRGT